MCHDASPASSTMAFSRTKPAELAVLEKKQISALRRAWSEQT